MEAARGTVQVCPGPTANAGITTVSKTQMKEEKNSQNADTNTSLPANSLLYQRFW